MTRRWMRVAAGAVAAVVGLTVTSAGTPGVLAAEPGRSAGVVAAAVAPAFDPNQDGKDLFTAVFFLVGPEASVVAEATKAPSDAVAANQTPEALEYVETIVKQIAQVDPGFFAEFSERMRSGDPFAVEQALDQGRQTIMDAMEALRGTIEPPDSYQPDGWFFALTVALAAAVVTYVVGANVAVMASHFWVGSSPLGDLSEEQAIAIMTTTLAG